MLTFYLCYDYSEKYRFLIAQAVAVCLQSASPCIKYSTLLFTSSCRGVSSTSTQSQFCSQVKENLRLTDWTKHTSDKLVSLVFQDAGLVSRWICMQPAGTNKYASWSFIYTYYIFQQAMLWLSDSCVMTDIAENIMAISYVNCCCSCKPQLCSTNHWTGVFVFQHNWSQQYLH